MGSGKFIEGEMRSHNHQESSRKRTLDGRFVIHLSNGGRNAIIPDRAGKV